MIFIFFQAVKILHECNLIGTSEIESSFHIQIQSLLLFFFLVHFIEVVNIYNTYFLTHHLYERIHFLLQGGYWVLRIQTVTDR